LGTNFEMACRQTAKEIAELVISKQHDYGKNNILDFGETGVLIRANDKFSRLKNLLKLRENPKNEAIEDTWTDVAGYAIIALMLRRNIFNLPMEEKND